MSSAATPAISQAATPAAGLYVHVPFCSAICPYCDFAVLRGGRQRRASFVASLRREIDLWRRAGADGWQAPCDTIYFGGGTPSLLEPAEIALLVDDLRAALPVVAGAALFLEANPEDVNAATLAAWRQLGVATLSLGIQSFHPEALRFLGRRHTAEQAAASVRLAGAAGFATVSIDLIYGLPEQPLAAWRATIEEAVRLRPDHLSCYQLTIAPGTPFGRRAARGERLKLPEPRQAELFDFTHSFLGDHGYAAYEVSNFARHPEHRSRHNQKYWDHTPYLGLGPSAHSFDGRRRRWWNERRLPAYQARIAAGERPVAGGEELAPAALALEALMLGLRTTDGIDLGRFRARFGCDLLGRNRQLVERLTAAGLLEARPGRLVPTPAGLAVADALAGAFELEPEDFEQDGGS
ncbi:MAG TPA: radical SAM family heme chaperone HemW [Thermoanaerobaculia bacterium]|nr:radical SAM family heme chaperone HemW [Thermoanaerobaculia bacterium]